MKNSGNGSKSQSWYMFRGGDWIDAYGKRKKKWEWKKKV